MIDRCRGVPSTFTNEIIGPRETERERERDYPRQWALLLGEGEEKKYKGTVSRLKYDGGINRVIEPTISIVPRMEDSAFLAIPCHRKPEAGIS
jgi:hypothetical protein